MGEYQAKFPHCDDRVLHAPGTCRFCDQYPHEQDTRILRGVNFTRENDPTKLPCPSTMRRSLETIERWPGNRPTTERWNDGVQTVGSSESPTYRFTMPEVGWWKKLWCVITGAW